MLAESDKNKYEMPETNVENLAYESKMINIVIGKVHQIYTDVTSDDIARYVRQILAEDEYHRMKPTEVAKEVVAIITGSPTRKKRRPSSKAPASMVDFLLKISHIVFQVHCNFRHSRLIQKQKAAIAIYNGL